jgi:hypothetical protein
MFYEVHVSSHDEGGYSIFFEAETCHLNDIISECLDQGRLNPDHVDCISYAQKISEEKYRKAIAQPSKTSLTINLPCSLEFDDRKEIPVFAERLQAVIPGVKVFEHNYLNGKYVAIAHLGKKDDPRVLALVDKIRKSGAAFRQSQGVPVPRSSEARPGTRLGFD